MDNAGFVCTLCFLCVQPGTTLASSLLGVTPNFSGKFDGALVPLFTVAASVASAALCPPKNLHGEAFISAGPRNKSREKSRALNTAFLNICIYIYICLDPEVVCPGPTRLRGPRG